MAAHDPEDLTSSLASETLQRLDYIFYAFLEQEHIAAIRIQGFKSQFESASPRRSKSPSLSVNRPRYWDPATTST